MPHRQLVRDDIVKSHTVHILITSFLAPQIRIMSEMLTLEKWRDAPLTLHFFNSSYLAARAGCPPLPAHVRLDVAPMQVSRPATPCPVPN